MFWGGTRKCLEFKVLFFMSPRMDIRSMEYRAQILRNGKRYRLGTEGDESSSVTKGDSIRAKQAPVPGIRGDFSGLVL